MGFKQGQEALDNLGSGAFLKFEDDEDKAVVAFPFCGEEVDDDPVVQDYHWNNKTDEMELYTAQHKEDGKKVTSKFHFTVAVFSENDTKHDPPLAKILVCNSQTYKDILKVRDKYGLGKKTFEIERKGKKGDTKTKYTVLPEDEITDKIAAKIAKIERCDIKKVIGGGDGKSDKKSEKTKSNGKSSSGSNGDGGLISSELATEIVQKLKALPEPREAAEKLIKKFGVERIKDIKASDAKEAKKYAEELASAGKEAPVENDPFG